MSTDKFAAALVLSASLALPAGAADIETGPFPSEFAAQLAACRELVLGRKATSMVFKATLRKIAPQAPLVPFNYDEGVYSFSKVLLKSPVGFDAFRIRIPEGTNGDLYAFTARTQAMQLRDWFVEALGDKDFEGAGLFMPFICGYANQPWRGLHMLTAQPWGAVRGGCEYLFWFNFDGPATQALHVSMKLLPEGEEPGGGWAGDALHGLERGQPPASEATPTEHFLAACAAGDVAKMRDLAAKGGVDIQYGIDSHGRSALGVAIDTTNHAVLKALFDLGADPNGVATLGHPTLAFAAVIGNLGAMDVLVRGGAAVDHPNGYGMTALSLAAYKGKTESVRHLLELGADPARTNRFGFSAIDQARTKGHTEIVTLLEKADRKP